MSETFEQLLSTYIQQYIESEKGQQLIEKLMTKHISEFCLRRLNTILDNVEDKINILLYTPYKQISLLIDQCDDVKEILANYETLDFKIDLSDLVLDIFKCCNLIDTYVHEVTLGETDLTRKVDQIILKNSMMISRAKFHLGRKSADNLLGESVHRNSLEGYNGPERADESKLKKLGYSVSQNNGMSDYQRQRLLKSLIEKNEISKGYVISHLKYMIKINGKKEANYMAVEKWKRDLQYVLNL